MAIPKDLFFLCSACSEPLIARFAEAGMQADCPHCFKRITVPTHDVEVVDKNRFQEPLGLRRILLEVRNEEWEKMRRKLHEAKARIAALEKELGVQRSPEAEGTAATEEKLLRIELNRRGRRSGDFPPQQNDVLEVA